MVLNSKIGVDVAKQKEIAVAADKRIKAETDIEKKLAATVEKEKMIAAVGEEERKQIAAMLVEIVSEAPSSQMQYGSFSGVYREEAEQAYAKIKQGQEENRSMTANTKSFLPVEALGVGLNGENLAKGVYELHAYTVLGVHEEKEPAGEGKKEKTIKFVSLRNPWGEGIGQYQKHDNDSIQHKMTDKESETSKKSEGVTIMELNEFMSKYKNLAIN